MSPGKYLPASGTITAVSMAPAGSNRWVPVFAALRHDLRKGDWERGEREERERERERETAARQESECASEKQLKG